VGMVVLSMMGSDSLFLGLPWLCDVGLRFGGTRNGTSRSSRMEVVKNEVSTRSNEGNKESSDFERD
jgi:hypothetical protein